MRTIRKTNIDWFGNGEKCPTSLPLSSNGQITNQHILLRDFSLFLNFLSLYRIFSHSLFFSLARFFSLSPFIDFFHSLSLILTLFQSLVYHYSEFLKNVTPWFSEVQNQFSKWWIQLADEVTDEQRSVSVNTCWFSMSTFPIWPPLLRTWWPFSCHDLIQSNFQKASIYEQVGHSWL